MKLEHVCVAGAGLALLALVRTCTDEFIVYPMDDCIIGGVRYDFGCDRLVPRGPNSCMPAQAVLLPVLCMVYLLGLVATCMYV